MVAAAAERAPAAAGTGPRREPGSETPRETRAARKVQVSKTIRSAKRKAAKFPNCLIISSSVIRPPGLWKGQQPHQTCVSQRLTDRSGIDGANKASTPTAAYRSGRGRWGSDLVPELPLEAAVLRCGPAALRPCVCETRRSVTCAVRLVLRRVLSARFYAFPYVQNGHRLPRPPACVGTECAPERLRGGPLETSVTPFLQRGTKA